MSFGNVLTVELLDMPLWYWPTLSWGMELNVSYCADVYHQMIINHKKTTNYVVARKQNSERVQFLLALFPKDL